MENQRDDLVVALPDTDRMDTFFTYIPGMMSRIGNHIDFPDYGADELTQIAAGHGWNSWNTLTSAPTRSSGSTLLRMRCFFSNARTARMDRARMNSAIPVFDKFAIRGENGGVCTVAGE
jgi:hypothetical protein